MRMVAMLIALFGVAVVPAAELKIVPASSKIEFVGTKTGGSHTGGFKQFSGTVTMPSDDFAAATVSLEIVTDSIFTDTAKLTQHLKTNDFFDVRTYPKATFISTAIAPTKIAGATHQVTGDLTLHGVKKSLTIPVKVAKNGDAVTIDGTFSLPREDFGMTYGKGMIKNEVKVTLSIKTAK